jgi:hypothetical protein
MNVAMDMDMPSSFLRVGYLLAKLKPTAGSLVTVGLSTLID